MSTIPPSVIPLIPPGELFSRLTTDTSISIRFLVAADPVFFEALNRPTTDVAVRQLILAKSLDQIAIRLGHQALFPFVVQPKLVTESSTLIDVPFPWIWDLHVSLPQKWESLRLAVIRRLSGSNAGSGSDGAYTGKLRLVFTAQIKGSITEVAIFTAEYTIDSPLTFQISRVSAPVADDFPIIVSSNDEDTIDGFINFKLLDTEDATVQTFLNALTPPGLGSEGSAESPNDFEIADNNPGGESVEDDFSLSAISHGTGFLTVSAFNSIPTLDSDPNVWLSSFNFPFRIGASRISTTPSTAPITVPKVLFSEFDICAPCSDRPSGDISGAFSPVWLNRIVREDASADKLRFVFATLNITDDQTSNTPIEFAELTLERSFTAGTVVEIKAIDNLLLNTGSGSDDKFLQGFGKGHVVLSDKWGGTTSEIEDFFDAFIPIIDDPAAAIFTEESTIISHFALSRSSKNTPTKGQSEALRGTSARRESPVDPSDENRYVTEQDNGLGDSVDFSSAGGGLPESKRENVDIERFGFKGGLARPLVTLRVNSSGSNHDYDPDILPRLKILLGRDPMHGDQWFDGTRIKTFVETSDGQGVWIG